MRIFIIIIQQSEESDPIEIVECSYYAIAVFIGGTWYSVNKHSRKFLNENNIEIFICFQNIVHQSPILSKIL